MDRMKNTARESHWDDVYKAGQIDRLGWYETDPVPSLRLIEAADVSPTSTILDVGSGASTLIPALLHRGFENVVAVDISRIAIEKAKVRLGPERARRVRWFKDNVTEPEKMASLGHVDLWHDRAMFHFLLSEDDRDGYVETLHALVAAGAYVVMGVFSLAGVTKCSGLDVCRYDETMLNDVLGTDFRIVESFDHEYMTPSGQSRPYIYCLFRRIPA